MNTMTFYYRERTGSRNHGVLGVPSIHIYVCVHVHIHVCVYMYT